MSTEKEKLMLQNVYYQPNNLWIGGKAITKLSSETKISKDKIKSWIAHQAAWQVHLPPPKHVDHPHYMVTEPNKLHQADTLYLPHDSIYGTTYKYVLNVEDVASRYNASRPRKTKKTSETEDLLKDIYKKAPLKYPKEFQSDNGSEFKGGVTKLLKTNGVQIRQATTKYKHTHAALVENFNKILSVKLFKIQDAQELNDYTKDSKTWIKHLYKIVDDLNKEPNKAIGMSPNEAIKLKKVTFNYKDYPNEEVLPEDGLYRYLYQPGELEGGQQRRATDMNWSWNTFTLDRIVHEPKNRILYYLAGNKAPNRSFVCKELMLISRDTQLPPDWVKNW